MLTKKIYFLVHARIYKLVKKFKSYHFFNKMLKVEEKGESSPES